MRTWQHLFQKHILGRGLDYYIRGLVGDLYVDEDTIKAFVYGTEEYSVFIDINDGEVIDMECDCPYAFDGSYCKHMAAVLFCAEDEGEDHINREKTVEGTIMGDKTKPEAKIDIDDLVREADETLVRNFLIYILKDNEKLLNRFKSATCREISQADMKRYKNQINRVFRRYAGKHDFIDYYNAGAFISELMEFLCNDIQIMLDNKHYEEVFELTNHIFIKIDNQNMDDSDGGIGIIAEICLEIWQGILAYCDMDLKRKMFSWYTNHLDGSVTYYMEGYIEQILFDNFMEEEFIEAKLKFIEYKIALCKREEDSWQYRYNLGKWVLRYIDILKEQEVAQDIIDEYCIKNLESDTVRKYYVESCIKRKKYDTAIRVLTEGKQADKGLPGLVADYSLQLKDLYKKLGNKEAYEKELWLLVLEYKAGNVDLYRELKSIYTDEEWTEKREIVFEKLPIYAGVDKFYEMEKLYDRLLEVVLNYPGIQKLTEYEKCLKDVFPKELLGKYRAVVEEMAGHASNRKRYREIVSILRRMQKYPEGKKWVDEIVSNWQERYKNRSAMMDELGKL